MRNTKEYIIPFVGLKVGKHHFEYQINNKFFELFDFDEYISSDIKVKVVLDKKSNMLELSFSQKGTVNVPCDTTAEEFDLPIKSKLKIIVRFGDEFNNDNEELLILPHGEFEIDIAQYIYEMIVLSVPQKRIHPGIKDGSLKSEALEKLNELKVKEKDIQQEDDIDPRWDKLKQLLTDK
jgi:uncharacterized metal-binding protein YceD (DUF177 family)